MSTPTRTCAQCGTPLAPNERFCGNCGTPYVEPTATDPTQYSGYPNQVQRPQTQPPTQYAEQPYREASSPYGTTGYDPGYAAPPPPPNASYPTPGPYTPTPTPQYGSNPSYPGAYGATPSQPGTYPPQQMPPLQPVPPRKKSNIGLIIGIVAVVLVVIIAACVGGLLYLGKQSITNNPTPVATQATNTNTPTSTPTPAPQALFVDKFADNSQGWDVTNQKGYSSTISNNVLTLKEANKKVYPMVIPTRKSYDDFVMTATVTLVKGDENDSAGVLVRAGSDRNQGYYVDIYGDNTYDIAKVYSDGGSDNKVSELISPTSSPALNERGTANTIRLIVKGSTLVLYLNDQKVNSVTDSNFSSGPAYLFAENGNTSDGVVATFSRVEIDAAPDTLPSA